MKAREFWILFAPSFLVMGGLLVIPLVRTIQWSFESVRYGTPGTFVGLDNFADALTDRPDPLAQAVEPAPEEHAHEHPVHRPEAAEVARGVGLVGAPALPVGHAPGADHDLADVGLGPGADALGVQRAGRYVALGAAGRGVGHVLDREAVARVEIRQRAALRVLVPGTHQLAVVAAVDAVAQRRAQLDGDGTGVLDRQVRDAAPRVEPVRRDDGARRADRDAGGARRRPPRR